MRDVSKLVAVTQLRARHALVELPGAPMSLMGPRELTADLSSYLTQSFQELCQEKDYPWGAGVDRLP